MSAPFNRNQTQERVVDLACLPLDMRRMISIQFREFIHHIEDSQPENEMEHSPRMIYFLECCYGEKKVA
jgi:hypothetical protein